MKEIDINVAGQSFKIKSDADEEHIANLAKEISRRFRVFKSGGTGSRAEQDIRALAMVSIALLDELNISQEEHKSLLDQTKSFSKKMISRIDDLLTTNDP